MCPSYWNMSFESKWNIMEVNKRKFKTEKLQCCRKKNPHHHHMFSFITGWQTPSTQWVLRYRCYLHIKPQIQTKTTTNMKRAKMDAAFLLAVFAYRVLVLTTENRRSPTEHPTKQYIINVKKKKEALTNDLQRQKKQKKKLSTLVFVVGKVALAKSFTQANSYPRSRELQSCIF